PMSIYDSCHLSTWCANQPCKLNSWSLEQRKKLSQSLFTTRHLRQFFNSCFIKKSSIKPGPFKGELLLGLHEISQHLRRSYWIFAVRYEHARTGHNGNQTGHFFRATALVSLFCC